MSDPYRSGDVEAEVTRLREEVRALKAKKPKSKERRAWERAAQAFSVWLAVAWAMLLAGIHWNLGMAIGCGFGGTAFLGLIFAIAFCTAEEDK